MSISVVFARSMILELQSRGIDAQRLLRATNIEASRVADIRESIGMDQIERLVDRAIELTGDEGLGLAVGAASPKHSLHVFAHLLLAQETARDAFAMAERYSDLVASSSSWRLLEQGDVASWGLVSSLAPGRLRRVLMDYAAAITHTLGRALLPRSPGGLFAVCFQHEPTDYMSRYSEAFGCPVRFEQPINGLTFPHELLDRPRAHADATIAVMMRETAERLLQEREQSGSVGARVRAVLHYEVDLSDASLNSVARACRMTPRLLRRRLLEEGLSYSTLLDEARCRVACGTLQRRESSIRDIAEQLGFSEPSAFFRAFKRWTGKTPNQFRHDASQDCAGDA